MSTSFCLPVKNGWHSLQSSTCSSPPRVDLVVNALPHVQTPFGAVRDVGTRFEVAAVDGAWRVRVREGLVLVEEMEEVLGVVGGRAGRHPLGADGAHG